MPATAAGSISSPASAEPPPASFPPTPVSPKSGAMICPAMEPISAMRCAFIAVLIATPIGGRGARAGGSRSGASSTACTATRAVSLPATSTLSTTALGTLSMTRGATAAEARPPTLRVAREI
eukprot:scaffold15973_cov137-Isochrysis_galbana.AAC.13